MADAAGYGRIEGDRLRGLVERIERLDEERAALAGDIKDIYAEAKSAGFDVKVLRRLVALRRLDAAEVEEQEALLDVYRRALGMLAETPLGEAPIASVTLSSGSKSVTLTGDPAKVMKKTAAKLRERAGAEAH